MCARVCVCIHDILTMLAVRFVRWRKALFAQVTRDWHTPVHETFKHLNFISILYFFILPTRIAQYEFNTPSSHIVFVRRHVLLPASNNMFVELCSPDQLYGTNMRVNESRRNYSADRTSSAPRLERWNTTMPRWVFGNGNGLRLVLAKSARTPPTLAHTRTHIRHGRMVNILNRKYIIALRRRVCLCVRENAFGEGKILRSCFRQRVKKIRIHHSLIVLILLLTSRHREPHC